MITSMAAILAITGGAYAVLRDQAPGSDPVAAAAADLPVGTAGKALMQARQHMIQLDAAAKTMTVVGTPKIAAQPAPSQTVGTAGSSGGSSGGSGGGAPVVTAPPPSPGTAEHIAYELLPSFGFNAASQFPCVNDIFTRESGWRVNAENASGAYGIPQALPGSKMASAGPDWQTDATTQIKWGLGYMKSIYGSPCQAWAFWQAHSYY